MSRILASDHELLGDLAIRIQHPLEIQREYVEDGLSTVMAGNVRPNWVDTNTLPMMDAALADTLARNLLVGGDILLVRTGANYGTVAPWKYGLAAYACADLLVVRSPTAPAGYISSFLTGKFGKLLVDRCSYGSAQPHISPGYISLIPIPRFKTLEAEIDRLVDCSVSLEARSRLFLEDAESILLDELGFCDWQPFEPLSYTQTATLAERSGRLDANYFAPKYADLLARLNATGRASRLGDGLTTIIARGSQPIYADEGLPVINSKHVRANRVLLDERNRRARPKPLRIQTGDVLVNGTGVGTIGRAAPYLGAGEVLPDNHVTIIRPQGLDPLFLSVFLNTKLGQMQIERMISGSSGQIELYPDDIRNVVVWCAPERVQHDVANRVRNAFATEAQSNSLLSTAKHAVEIAIESGEIAALEFIAEEQEARDAAAL